ncbi:hypothetical protein, partial [Sansalvadorimonas verongulae]|uniref:hypothetical protein n=1 Tax=Sansalvadorimonas verongulae TaxID=2172824 RepID=UPI0018AD274E
MSGFNGLTQKKEKNGEETRISIVSVGKKPQEFIELSPSDPPTRGTLHVTILRPRDQESSSTSLSITYSSGNSLPPPSYEDITPALQDMVITEWQPGKLGVTLPARENALSSLSLNGGSARLTAPEHEIIMAFSCKNTHWNYILSKHPEIMLDHQGYTFNSTKDLETRPANDLIVIMHLIDDHKRSRVTIHTVKGLETAGAEGEDYTLDTAERSQLIRLAPTETFVALARHVNIPEPDIASVTT